MVFTFTLNTNVCEDIGFDFIRLSVSKSEVPYLVKPITIDAIGTAVY